MTVKKAAENYAKNVAKLEMCLAAMDFIRSQIREFGPHPAGVDSNRVTVLYDSLLSAELVVRQIKDSVMTQGMAWGYLAGDLSLIAKAIKEMLGDENIMTPDGYKIAIMQHLSPNLQCHSYSSDDEEAFKEDVKATRKSKKM